MKYKLLHFEKEPHGNLEPVSVRTFDNLEDARREMFHAHCDVMKLMRQLHDNEKIEAIPEWGMSDMSAYEEDFYGDRVEWKIEKED